MLNLLIFVHTILLLLSFLTWLCALTGRIATLASSSDTTTRHLVSQTTRGRCFTHPKCTASLSERNEKNTANVSCSYLQVCTDARSRVANTKGFTLFLFNAHGEAGRPSLFCALCLLSSKLKEITESGSREEVDIEIKAMREPIKLCATYIYLRFVLSHPSFFSD